jgi:hypothetical protein
MKMRQRIILISRRRRAARRSIRRALGHEVGHERYGSSRQTNLTDFSHARWPAADRPAIGASLAARRESKHPMSKRQLIDEIRRYNASVQPLFLAQFDETALKQYLQHLQSAAQKHVRIAGWVRRQPKLRLAS